MLIHAHGSDGMCAAWCRDIHGHRGFTVRHEGRVISMEHLFGRPDVSLLCVADVVGSMHDAWLDLIV